MFGNKFFWCCQTSNFWSAVLTLFFSELDGNADGWLGVGGFKTVANIHVHLQKHCVYIHTYTHTCIHACIHMYVNEYKILCIMEQTSVNPSLEIFVCNHTVDVVFRIPGDFVQHFCMPSSVHTHTLLYTHTHTHCSCIFKLCVWPWFGEILWSASFNFCSSDKLSALANHCFPEFY